jgi:RNA polymerase sigma-70 factor (ECF subfamily)
MTDEQLLGSYVEGRDDAAFEALVRRHGPMVWGVCRRLLSRHEDAEDAFQATFLVLVRKARSISSRNLVGNWLYGVAYQTALKARALAAQRRTRERQVAEMPEPAARSAETRIHDWQPLLDQALSSLPRKYRAAIVLCDLEGLPYKEAALQLGWPQGTLSVRLMRARQMLARRLKRNVGSAPDAHMLRDVLSEDAATGRMPASLVVSTVSAANLFAAGQAAAAGAISAHVAALTEGVLKAMFFTKLKIAAAILLLALASTGAGLLAYSAVTDKAGADKAAVAEKSDDEKIQGAWTFVSQELAGQPFVAADANSQYVFNGKKLRWTGNDWTFKLNAAKKPKEIDLIMEKGVTKGIYALDGDNLKITLALGDKDRPTEFATKPGDGHYHAVLKRK